MLKTLPLSLLFVLVISILTLLPLFKPGFFSVHDATQTERVFVMAKALKDGQFPVRIVEYLGYDYGYPIFNFYAPLPYYLGGILHALGIDLLASTKLMFAVGILFSAVSMYLLAKNVWGEKAGVLSAVLYVFAPYHALDIYVRGAVGEFWAVAFLPLVFLAIYKEWMIVGGLALAGVILSHNLTAMMLVPFIVLFMLVLLFTKTNKIFFLKKFFLFVVIGLAISAFYFLPALLEMSYTNVSSQITGGSQYFQHFIDLDQLWDFPWGFGGSSGRESGISFKIGKIGIILSLCSLLLFFIAKKKVDRKKEIMLFGLITIGLSVFFTNRFSQPLWEIFSFLKYVQFPWRFLIFIVFGTSLLGGAVFYYVEKAKLPEIFSRVSFLGISLVVSAVVFFQFKYFQPQFAYSEKSSFYANEERIRWDVSKISDEYLPNNFPKVGSEKEIIKAGYQLEREGTVKEVIRKSHKREYLVNFPQKQKMLIYLASFPGWEVKIDGKKTSLLKEDFISFFVPAGKHQIEVYFSNTWPRILGNIITIFGLSLVGVILISKKYAKNT